METLWYECNKQSNEVILHVKSDRFVKNGNSCDLRDLWCIISNALKSFSAFTGRNPRYPRYMHAAMPVVWLSTDLYTAYIANSNSYPAVRICGMPVHIMSSHAPNELTIEWRDDEFVNMHTLGASYISDYRSPYRRLPLNYDDLVIRPFFDGLTDLERRYCEADVKATCALWAEFCCMGMGKRNKKNTIKKVIFNDPATIVYWTDGTKTIVKRQPGDKKFDPEKGLAMAYVKHELGLKEFNKLLENAEVHNGKKK